MSVKVNDFTLHVYGIGFRVLLSAALLLEFLMISFLCPLVKGLEVVQAVLTSNPHLEFPEGGNLAVQRGTVVISMVVGVSNDKCYVP